MSDRKYSRGQTQSSGVAHFSSGSKEADGDNGSGPAYTTGCKFEGNNATDGGAMYSAAGYDKIVDSSFTGNLAGR